MLSYVILLAYTVGNFMNTKFGKFIGSLFLIFWIYFNYPLFSEFYIQQSKVSVPSYYSDLNNYVNKNKIDIGQRVLILPLTGEGINTDWGYSGVEPSIYLFNFPTFSYLINAPVSIDHATNFATKINYGQDITSELSNLGVKYLVVRGDLPRYKFDINSLTQGKYPDTSKSVNFKCKNTDISNSVIVGRVTLLCSLNEDLEGYFYTELNLPNSHKKVEVNLIDNNGKRLIWRDLSFDNLKNLLVDLKNPYENSEGFNYKQVASVYIVFDSDEVITNELASSLSLKKIPINLINTQNSFKEISEFGKLSLYENLSYTASEKDYSEISRDKFLYPNSTKNKIILNKTYNSLWKLAQVSGSSELEGGFLNNLLLLNRREFSTKHNIEYGYANSWDLPYNSENIGVIFVPQLLFEIGYVISLASFMLICGFFLIGNLNLIKKFSIK
jgi:hypothetical protein